MNQQQFEELKTILTNIEIEVKKIAQKSENPSFWSSFWHDFFKSFFIGLALIFAALIIYGLFWG